MKVKGGDTAVWCSRGPHKASQAVFSAIEKTEREFQTDGQSLLPHGQEKQAHGECSPGFQGYGAQRGPPPEGLTESLDCSRQSGKGQTQESCEWP